MLSEEQVKHIKQQIIQQMESWHATPEQKEQAKKQVLAMSAEEIEQFLIKNKLLKPKSETAGQETTETTGQPTTQKAEKTAERTSERTAEQQQCPFCFIIGGKIPSYKIDENKQSIAVLEINPLSKGHIIIIPKPHKKMEKIPSQAFTLAKKITRRIKSKLKPEKISMQTEEVFEHGAINIIPVYKDEKPERYKAGEEELKKLQEKLKFRPRAETARTKKTKEKAKKEQKLEKAPKRFP